VRSEKGDKFNVCELQATKIVQNTE